MILFFYFLKEEEEHCLFSLKVTDFALHAEPLWCYSFAHTNQCTDPPPGCLGGHMTGPHWSCDPGTKKTQSASQHACPTPPHRWPVSPSL